MSAPWPSGPPGVSTIDVRARRAADLGDRVGVDLAAADVGVPVGAGVELVAAVVGVHEVDAAGDGQHPVDDADQILAAGVRVAGVEAEAGTELADRVPEPGQPVEAPGHRVVAAGGVLDQDRQPEATLVGGAGERLAPVVEADRGIVAGVHVPAVHDQPLRADLGCGRLGVLAEQLAAGDADAVVQWSRR